MPAGDSAAAEAQRQTALAAEHERAAVEARQSAARYDIAAVTEKQTARTLARLAGVGYHLLADRAWPGSRRAQVDMVVIGPGGVFIVDTKAWAEVSIRGGSIFRGQEDVTDELSALGDLGAAAEAEFAEIGLAPGEVRVIAVLAGRQGVKSRIGAVEIVGEKDIVTHIASRGQRLTPSQVDTVLSRALDYFGQVRAPAPINAAVPEPVLPAPVLALQRPEQGELITDDEVTAGLLQGLLSAPIEEWMAFLHPAQARTVRRTFNGPARIRGGAGTGKTVVGLHRAAYLARTRPGTVLVTSFVKTLPLVLKSLLERLAPDVVDRVEFTGVHAFAFRLLEERGIRPRVDTQAVDRVWGKAWTAIGRGSLLDTDHHQPDYWWDEIQHVIKGRGLTRFDDYADLPRAGRRHRLGVAQRQVVWTLYDAYQRGLRQEQVHDFADLIHLASAELDRQPLRSRYSAVIVDEAQDMSCSMIRMLHGLVGDEQDGLTLIGDGQQTIYPGGFTLAEAGVSVAGRGVVLDINYRNTAQILNFASVLVADDEYADIEGATRRADAPAQVPRTGEQPIYQRFLSVGEHDRQLVQRVQDVVHEVGTGWGDVGVLSPTTAGARRLRMVLAQAGVPVVDLAVYDGRPVDQVKVGTVKRAKGLEFKQVMVADVHAEWFSGRRSGAGGEPTTEDPVEAERREYRMRELYVAMTRARDGLWVGAV